MNDALSDRRAHDRFEITGRLWAALDLSAVVRLRDLSSEGALIEAPRGQIWSAISTVAITLRDGLPPLTALVTRVSPHPEHADWVQVALRFLHPPPATVAVLEQMIAQWTE